MCAGDWWAGRGVFGAHMARRGLESVTWQNGEQEAHKTTDEDVSVGRGRRIGRHVGAHGRGDNRRQNVEYNRGRMEARGVASRAGCAGGGRLWPLLLLVLAVLLAGMPAGVSGDEIKDEDDRDYADGAYDYLPLLQVGGSGAGPVDTPDTLDVPSGANASEARLALPAPAMPPPPPDAPDGSYLMDVPRNVDNWSQVTSSFPAFYGWDWPLTEPCGQERTWSGVLCRGDAVISVNLANMRLRGQLAVDVLKVSTLEALDLSGNFFNGFLPPQWSSKTLKRLILSNNQLQGKLPAAYGAQDTFPAMERMMLDGNMLTGMLPGSQWLSGFAKQAIITLRPGNDELCGSVPVVDPKYYTSLPDAELFGAIEEDGLPVFLPDSAFAINTSQVYLVYTNLFANTPQVAYSEPLDKDGDDSNGIDISLPTLADVVQGMGETVADAFVGVAGLRRRALQQVSLLPNLQAIDASTGASYPNPTNVVITNTLGTCPVPCGKTAALPSANLLEAAWQLNVTLTDILRYNNGLEAANAVAGKVIALPCYDVGTEPVQSTSNAAADMFAGGNQRTVVGTVGAEIAGAVVRGDGLPVGKNGIYFEGIKDYVFYGGAMHTVLIEPMYWFVDLGAEYTVTAVTITSGNAMNGLSVYIGSDTQDVFGNKKGAANLQFATGETRMVSLPYIRGKYVILYAETNPFMSLANVKVWTAEGNMAVGKLAKGSSNMRFMNTSEISYGTIIPANEMQVGAGSDSCVMVGSERGEPFSLEVDNVADLGVESVSVDVRNIIRAEPGKDATITIYTSQSDAESGSPEDIQICKTHSVQASSVQIGADCSSIGRYVGIRFENVLSTEACELAEYVGGLMPAATVTVSSSDIVGIIVGSVVAGAVIALLLVAIVVWWRKRRNSRKIAANKMVFHDAEKGIVLPAVVTAHRNGSQTSQQSGSSLSPAYHKSTNNAKMDFIDFARSSKDQWSSLDHSPTKRENSNGGMSRSENLSTSISSSVDCIDFSDIELLRTIGEGSYGLVWLGRYLQTSVAVKVLTHDTKASAGWNPDQPPSDGALMALQKEASIMASLRHPNCVQYLGCCIDPPALVMEFCSRRSVDKILQEARNDPRAAKSLDWVHLLGIAADAAKGMLYLHTRSPPIIHRDLKSPNLLVDALWHVKISDFNLSRAMEQESFSTSLAITNPRWLAPEILRGEHGGRAADVYSFGVVLWELMSWRLPWGEEANPFSIINGVLNGKQLVIPGPGDLQGGMLPMYDRYVALIRDCWSMEATDRPTMAHVASELRSMLSTMLTSKINNSCTVTENVEVSPSQPSDESSE